MSAVMTLPSTSAPSSKNGLLKRITTKLRTPQPIASTSAAPAEAAANKPKRRGTVLPRPKAPVPALPNTFISAEQREAALLARGLVPRRLRDAHGERLPMSAQEAALDERFSVRLDSDSGSGSDSEASEARRIRADWLARNDGAGVAPRRASDEELAQSRTSLSAAAADERGVVIGTPAEPRRPRIVRAHEPPPLSPSQAELATTPPLSAGASFDSLDGACDPTRVPLPPSPTRSMASLWGAEITRAAAEAHDSGEGTAEADAGAACDTAVAPAMRAPENSRASGTASGAARAIEGAAEPPPPACSSPPVSFDDPRSPRHLPAPLLATMSTQPGPLERGRSFGGASATSMPALSPTRTASSSSTEPQTPHLDDARPRSGSTASGDSWRDLAKIRTEGKSMAGEVIVESPVEEEDTVPELPAPRARKVSTATEGGHRRGFFKRHSTGPTSPSQKAPSLGGLRRSVTGTISGKLGLRPKSLVVDTALVAQPPATSPVSPLSASAPTKLDVPRARVRQPLSPTMHTRGSIIIHAEEIEDEESRRLAEAAFLDF